MITNHIDLGTIVILLHQNSYKTSHSAHYNQKNRSNHKNNYNRHNDHTSKNNHNTSQSYYNTIANIPSLLDPPQSAPSYEKCSRCQQAGHQVPTCPYF